MGKTFVQEANNPNIKFQQIFRRNSDIHKKNGAPGTREKLHGYSGPVPNEKMIAIADGASLAWGPQNYRVPHRGQCYCAPAT
jgi:hypothetical protein